jgi:hypothetical protein
MDGRSVGCFLLLPARHFCSLANCGGDIRRAIQRRNVDFSSSVICWLAELLLNARLFSQNYNVKGGQKQTE